MAHQMRTRKAVRRPCWTWSVLLLLQWAWAAPLIKVVPGGYVVDGIRLPEQRQVLRQTLSPDGRWLTYNGFEKGLWLYDLRTGTKRVLAKFQDILFGDAVFSPDGRRLAWVSDPYTPPDNAPQGCRLNLLDNWQNRTSRPQQRELPEVSCATYPLAVVAPVWCGPNLLVMPGEDFRDVVLLRERKVEVRRVVTLPRGTRPAQGGRWPAHGNVAPALRGGTAVPGDL